MEEAGNGVGRRPGAGNGVGKRPGAGEGVGRDWERVGEPWELIKVIRLAGSLKR